MYLSFVMASSILLAKYIFAYNRAGCFPIVTPISCFHNFPSWNSKILYFWTKSINFTKKSDGMVWSSVLSRTYFKQSLPSPCLLWRRVFFWKIGLLVLKIGLEYSSSFSWLFHYSNQIAAPVKWLKSTKTCVISSLRGKTEKLSALFSRLFIALVNCNVE